MDLLVTDSDASTAVTESQDRQPKQRGVKRGTKRGHCKRTGAEKERVLTAALEDGSGDWRTIAAANVVSVGTAYDNV